MLDKNNPPGKEGYYEQATTGEAVLRIPENQRTPSSEKAKQQTSSNVALVPAPGLTPRFWAEQRCTDTLESFRLSPRRLFPLTSPLLPFAARKEGKMSSNKCTEKTKQQRDIHFGIPEGQSKKRSSRPRREPLLQNTVVKKQHLAGGCKATRSCWPTFYATPATGT